MCRTDGIVPVLVCPEHSDKNLHLFGHGSAVAGLKNIFKVREGSTQIAVVTNRFSVH